MKTYKITMPSITVEYDAKNKEEALEMFWFDYDQRQMSDYDSYLEDKNEGLIVKEIK